MGNWTLLTLTALAAGAIAAAVPAENLFKRAVTPDGTCGGSNGYTCPTGSSRCCSQWGWCGDSSEHCGTGCQSAFGACSGSPGNPPPSSTITPPSPTGISLPRTRPGNLPYGSWISTCTRPGFVALTFDDGPHIYTTQLLDLLKANGVVATFFVNGQNWGDPITVASKVAILRRMIADGHQIASHTWSHPDLNTLSESQIISQMTQLETAFIAAIGKFPTYMRPPYFSCGSVCLNTMARLGYHTIHADIDTLDWMYNTDATIGTSKNIFASAVNSASPSNRGFITLMHDVHRTTVTSLVQSTIDSLKAAGYRATTVGWCLDDHSSNWYRRTQ